MESVNTLHEVQKEDIFEREISFINDREKGGYAMTLLEQCQKWFKEGEVDKIEEVVMSLSEEERTPELLSELGRVWIYRSADSMIEEECCNRAIEILKPLEQDLSDNHNYQYRMGMAYEGLQQYQPAKAHFEKALELLPDDEDETQDTLAALRKAKKQGARVLSVVNVLGSSVTRESLSLRSQQI